MTGPLSSILSVLTHKMLQIASLQGYLLKNKTRPRACVEKVAEWCGWLFMSSRLTELTSTPNRVQQERAARAKISRE